MTHDITIEGGTSLRLKTAGKYCDRDIVVTSTGGGGAEIVLQSKSATPTKSVQEITADAGYTALERVTVAPIPDAYIIPAGTKAISQNGTHSVTEYAQVSVNVPIPDGYIKPAGTKTITENGAHDVTSYASVNVNVAGSGGDPKALLDAALNNTLTAIDSTVTSVVGYACRGLSKLKTVNLPNATSIGTYAFYYCTALSSFSAPKVTTLNTYAFYNCDKMSSINFPLATSVPTQCFYSCGILKKADFGAAKSIAASAFPYCAELDTLILRRSDAICTLANKNAFTETPIEDGTGYIYVPAALLSDYASASNWSNFSAQLRAIESYPDITGG